LLLMIFSRISALRANMRMSLVMLDVSIYIIDLYHKICMGLAFNGWALFYIDNHDGQYQCSL
jgi:hypothetical protein